MKRRKLINILKFVFGIAITVIAIYFTIVAFKDISFDLIIKAKINWALVLFSALLFLFSTVARAMSYSEGIAQEMTFLESWIVVGIGNSLNMVLPFHAGEGIRFAIFPKRINIANRTNYILITGFVDILIIMLVSLISASILNFQSSTYYQLIIKIITLTVISLFSLLFLILLIFKKSRYYLISILNIKLISSIKWIVLSWGLMLTSMFVVFISFGFNSNQSFMMTLTSVGGLNLAGLIPSSPGNVGLFEWAVIFSLRQSFVGNYNYQLIALVLHLTQYLALLPLGLLLALIFFRSNLKSNLIVLKRKNFK